ncbi:MAG: GNAT family N-acetyltransferase [Candidatus Epulonipiscioides saccharophilum]|nr:MAG: GNAT family N-acetyltransferase [Epulopiscium sp. AS2M-Bin001]
MNIAIRKMIKSDIIEFPIEFLKQGGHNKSEALFQKYFQEQEEGSRKLFIATVDNKIAGYATLLPQDLFGAFKGRNIPIIVDFNVLEKYQKHGVGTTILNYIEDNVKKYSSEICLGVGLHYGYGSAQRMYIKRGYIPDGSGVWFQDERLEQYAKCINDDELILYLSKKL